MIDLTHLDAKYSLLDYYIECGEYEKAERVQKEIDELQEFLRGLLNE